jgi:hypothetical protein
MFIAENLFLGIAPRAAKETAKMGSRHPALVPSMAKPIL